ncbi:hypothetical protein FGO68_gene10902 [Halteria grandinella]|uniref:Uncharacterized protein n=1 Tax=Halteria grandinella TaxID=5974 RepID=A0A8J8NA34_HALGN|nr:hypothetical protein FGO68_gene10902 [Halteria grandinella]
MRRSLVRPSALVGRKLHFRRLGSSGVCLAIILFISVKGTTILRLPQSIKKALIRQFSLLILSEVTCGCCKQWPTLYSRMRRQSCDIGEGAVKRFGLNQLRRRAIGWHLFSVNRSKTRARQEAKADKILAARSSLLVILKSAMLIGLELSPARV